MTTPRAGNLPLVGGLLALDFVNTASGRETADRFEHLRHPSDVVDWAAHAGSIDAETARRSYAVVTEDGEAAEKVLRHAVQLREAVYGVGSAIARGSVPPEADLRTLKAFARQAIGPADLAPAHGGGYGFDFSAGPAEIALLGPVAWSALDMLSGGNFERVKQCPGDDCGWLFFDNSKNNSRRWCEMATCGNRTKAKRHRHRH